MKLDVTKLAFKLLIIFCLVVTITSTCVFASNLNHSERLNVSNHEKITEYEGNVDEITIAKIAKEQSHNTFDKELIQLAASNNSEDKELAKKAWLSIKKYQDHSIILKSPNVPKMICYLNISDSDFEIIYNESCISGNKYNLLLNYVKTYNKKDIKLNEFKMNLSFSNKKYAIYFKNLTEEKTFLKQLKLEVTEYAKRKNIYDKNMINFKQLIIKQKELEKGYNDYIHMMETEKKEFEEQFEIRENIFKNEYEYLKESGMNCLMLQLLTNEYEATVNYLNVCLSCY